MPQTFKGLSADKRSRAQAAIIEFLTAIKQQDAEFLKLCIDKYREKILDVDVAGG